MYRSQPPAAGADDDALRARPVDDGAGRGVAVDSSCTLAERALGTTMRPTTPAGAITAMSGL